MRNELIVENDPKSPISEIFRTLRTNIQFTSSKEKNKTILITSTSQGEGKSWVTANLAVVFASTGKKVLLIDSDMRLGRQYKIFNISPIPGISNLLSGLVDNEKDVIQKVDGIENLSIIPAGDIPPNPSELLTSDDFNKLLNKFKKSYDVIIVDGPPISLVTDGLLIARIVDNTVVIVENKKIKKEQLKNVLTSITNVGGKIAGVVLNKAENYAKTYKNSYYYGHGNKIENLNSEINVDNNIDKVEDTSSEVESVIIDNVSDNDKNENDNKNVENKPVYTQEQVIEMQKQMQAKMQAAYQKQYQAYIYNYHKQNQLKINQKIHTNQNVNNNKVQTQYVQMNNVKPSVKVENK